MAASSASNSTAPARPSKTRIAIILAAVFFYWLSLYLYVPTLPVYVQTKTSDLALVGVVLSMYGLWQLIVRLPMGIAVDAVGWRKPFILFGLGLVALGAAVMGNAQSANGVLVGRALTGMGAATWVPLVVLFTSLFTAEEAVRATAALTIVNSVGRIAGTTLNGVLNQWGGYGLAFQVAIGTAAVAAVLVLVVRDRRRPARVVSARMLGELFTRPAVLLPALLSAALHYADWTATFSFTPLLARQFGANNLTISMLTTLNLVLVLVGNLLSAAAARHWGARRLVAVCFGFLTLGLAGAALSTSLPMVFAAQFCIGFAFGVGYPVLMGLSIQKVDHAEQNTAMGLHQSVYALGMFAGPWMSGILAKALGIQPMFGITAGVLLVLGILGIRALKT